MHEFCVVPQNNIIFLPGVEIFELRLVDQGHELRVGILHGGTNGALKIRQINGFFGGLLYKFGAHRFDLLNTLHGSLQEVFIPWITVLHLYYFFIQIYLSQLHVHSLNEFGLLSI